MFPFIHPIIVPSWSCVVGPLGCDCAVVAFFIIHSSPQVSFTLNQAAISRQSPSLPFTPVPFRVVSCRACRCRCGWLGLCAAAAHDDALRLIHMARHHFTIRSSPIVMPRAVLLLVEAAGFSLCSVVQYHAVSLGHDFHLSFIINQIESVASFIIPPSSYGLRRVASSAYTPWQWVRLACATVVFHTATVMLPSVFRIPCRYHAIC